MKKAKRISVVVLTLIAVIAAACIPVSAFQIQSNGGTIVTPSLDTGGVNFQNLAAGTGATIDGHSWATGDNRGFASLVNGTVRGGEGWIISYEYIDANCPNGEPILLNVNFADPTEVNAVVLWGSMEHVNWGLPARFQIVGTLADGSEVVLWDQTEYDYLRLEGDPLSGHRFNFKTTTVTKITLKCIAPGTQVDGKAMPDANCAYWLSELQVFNDVGEGSSVKPGNGNLAYLATVQTNASWHWDRNVVELNNGKLHNAFWGGGYLLIGDLSGFTSETPMELLFQFGVPTTMNNFKWYGRFPENNAAGLPTSYRIYAILGETETLIYDTENAANYPDVSVVYDDPNLPVEINFPRVTAEKIRVESFGWANPADNGLPQWWSEFEIYNKGGATAITVDKVSTALEVGASDTITASSDTASNQTLVWTTSDANVATVENGVITAVGAGSCTIRVAVADDPTVYADITVTVASSIVNPTGVTLDKTTTTILVNGSETLTATVAPEDATDKTIIWTSSDDSVVTVENGLIRGIAPGTATITATSSANGELKAVCEVTVEKVAVTGITINPATITLDKLDVETLVAVIAPENATYKNVRWESANPEAVSVNAQTGEIAALKGGVTVEIYAISTDDETIKATCTVTVNDVAVEDIYLFVDDSYEEELASATVKAGEDYEVIFMYEPEDATDVIWTSSDEKVATVVDGVVTGVAAGKATITVANADGSVTASFEITVTGSTAPDTGASDLVLPMALLAVVAGGAAIVISKKSK